LVDTLKPDILFQDSLKLSGDPAEAESQWRELRPFLSPAASTTDGLRFLLALLGNSRFLVHRLLQDADPTRAIDSLVLSPHLLKPKGEREMIEEIHTLRRSQFGSETARLLRAYKYREMTRIAARDLSGLAPFEEIGGELADLAAACTETALEASLKAGEAGGFHEPFVVLALGKFGGRDLNFSSDIDVLYLHGRPVEENAGARGVLEHFCRVAESVTKLLHDRTGDGFVFRVDLDLRPEGKSGVIVNSVEALTAYYETSGADWERAALVKARPVAGDAGLGREALAQIEPFVFPKYTDSSAIDGLKRMKEKINAELKKSKSGGFHVKLGVGGIREIEFFVTAFQLLFGGKEPSLRERHTQTALRRLRELGLVPAEDAERLEDAYVFLRRIENRLQMEEERQTHRLPTESAALIALARRMGFATAGDFETALAERTSFVASCFERLAS
jgi:glutamate-ammonia-ligase adenylyltransferase